MAEYQAEHYKESVVNKTIKYSNTKAEVSDNKKKKKVNIFAVTLLCMFTILLSASVIIWNELWNFLVSYEKTNEEYVIDDYMQVYEQNDFKSVFTLMGVNYDQFNSEEDYINFFKENYSESLTDAKAIKIGSENGNLTYSVCVGENIKISGFVLSPDGNPDKYGHQGWKVTTEQTAEKLFPKMCSAKIYVPKGTSVCVNGKELGAEYLSSEGFSIKEYNDLDDETLRPVFEVYDTGDIFLNKPEITAYDKASTSMKLTEKDGAYYAFGVLSNEELENIKAFAEEFSVTYAKYVTKDVPFDNIIPYLVKESEYYRRVRAFYNEYYRDHTLTYDNVKFGEPIVYDDTHVVIDISFDYHVNIGYKTNDYNVKYTLILIKLDGKWKIASMML
jgi:hypothetical protein